MRIGHILHLSGMNRDTYNSLKRRGHLTFMDNRVGDDEARGFTTAHALALVAFQTFRRNLVEVDGARVAINDSWPDIVRTVGLIDEAPKNHLCGIRINDIGVHDTWGWPHPQSKGAAPIAGNFVDLARLWADLQPALATLVEPASDEEDDTL